MRSNVVWLVTAAAAAVDLGAAGRRDMHAEYVKYASGRDTVTAYLAYPERRDPAPAVIVIHEIFGLSDFIRQTTLRQRSRWIAGFGFRSVRQPPYRQESEDDFLLSPEDVTSPL